ncbi:hypothetical protein [Bergeyella zoohelcum]|uniref:Lipoprotein n=1 Tax=Bergeyella zoohelcum TaxID=1015 RepID=A0A380ZVE9_9FLAO|nr:hypothetical protein [Bergeyella zoohelcum]SUV52758.1 Uncharacterised protein [Bergeyella zoohelcum]
MMKLLKLIIALCIIASCNTQKKQKIELEYIAINYSSVCCGPQSDVPVRKFLSSYAKKNRQKDFVVMVTSGLGREGEFTLHIEIEKNMKNKKDFLEQLGKAVQNQNNNRTENDGYVYLEESVSPPRNNKISPIQK